MTSYFTPVPYKFKRHFTTKHSHLQNKTVDYFKSLLRADNKGTLDKKYGISEKAQEVSYLIAYCPGRKSHTVGKNLIMPANKIIVGKILGQDAVQKIEKNPLSDSTITSLRISMICLVTLMNF